MTAKHHLSLSPGNDAPLGERIRSRRVTVGAMALASTGVPITVGVTSGANIYIGANGATPLTTLPPSVEVLYGTSTIAHPGAISTIISPDKE